MATNPSEAQMSVSHRPLSNSDPSQQIASDMVGMVKSIWARIFNRFEIRVDDDFFEIGGNPSLASKLFSEIHRESGRKISPVMIHHAPTIVALSCLLEESFLSLPKLVPLKTGSALPAIFFACGLEGTVNEFFELVRNIRLPYPIYGLQALDPDGRDVVFERIEEMAEFYLDAIRNVQPRGPYLLVGYSMGGLVMLEIARRLSHSGETIGLVMLDTYPHKRFLRLRQRLRIAVATLRHHAPTIRQLPIREAIEYVLSPSKRMSSRGWQGLGEVDETCEPDERLSGAMQEAERKRVHRALKTYRPRPYNGRINFVRAEIASVFSCDPVAVWGHLVDELEVQTVSGNHWEMLSTQELASLLTCYLRDTIEK